MDHTPAHYLDVLPAHPQPRPLESLNSYTKRLAMANGIHHINAFAHLAALHHSRYLLSNKYPPTFGHLARIAACPEEHLRALTYYHLTLKFDRVQVPARFLECSTVKHLRYCPHCLAEKEYHSLVWCFPRIHGCPDHGVQLLECCGHCQTVIALTNPFLHVAVCPSCMGDLGQCSAAPLSPAEQHLCAHRWDDLAYLLSPQSWENDESPVAAAAHQRLAFGRMTQQITAKQVGLELGLRHGIIGAIENETQTSMGETFQDYLDYADHLGLSLSEAFRVAAETGYIHKTQLRQDAFLAQVQQAVDTLKQQGEPVIRKQVAQLVACSPHTLRKHPRIRLLLNEEVQRQQAACRPTPAQDQAMCLAVRQAIDDLNAQGKRVTRHAVGLIVGQTPEQLKRNYPCADTLLNEFLADCEADLLAQVKQAIQELSGCSQRITLKGIAHHMGTTPRILARRPAIWALVDEAIRQTKHWPQKNRLAQVEAAVTVLRNKGLPITQNSLAETAGIPLTIWRYDLVLQDFWKSFVANRRRAREDDLVQQVHEAILQLEAQQIPLTLYRIGQLVGMTQAGMKRYTRVRQIFEAYHLLRGPNSKTTCPPAPRDGGL